MEYYLLTIRGYYGKDLYFEEVFRFDSLKDAHAYAGRLIQSMDIDSLGDRYDIRLGWDYNMPPVA